MLYGTDGTSMRRNLAFLTNADLERLAPTPRELHALARADEIKRKMVEADLAPTLIDRSIDWLTRRRR